MDSKVLILGHGWRMFRNGCEPRCAPMELEEWNALVRDAPQSNLLFMDMDESAEPDIVENMGNNWMVHKELMRHSFDYIIDATSHLATKPRCSIHYWDGVKGSLKMGGTYIGWNDKMCHMQLGCKKDLHVRIARGDIDEFIKTTYDKLSVPRKPFELLAKSREKPLRRKNKAK